MKTLRAPIIILNYVFFFLQRSLAAIVLERLFFFNEKILVLEEIGFSKKNPYKENPFLMYEPCVVVCEDFDFIKVSLCV